MMHRFGEFFVLPYVHATDGVHFASVYCWMKAKFVETLRRFGQALYSVPRMEVVASIIHAGLYFTTGIE